MQWFNRGINEEGRLLAEDCLLAQPIGGSPLEKTDS